MLLQVLRNGFLNLPDDVLKVYKRVDILVIIGV